MSNRSSNKKMREQVLQQGIFPMLDNVTSMETLKRMAEFRLDQANALLLDRNLRLHTQKKCSQCARYVLFEHGKERSSLYCLECTANDAFVLCRVCQLEQKHDSTHTVVLYVGDECMGKVVKMAGGALAEEAAVPLVSIPKPAKRTSKSAPSFKAHMLPNSKVKSTNPNMINLMDDEGNVLYYINQLTGESTFYPQ